MKIICPNCKSERLVIKPLPPVRIEVPEPVIDLDAYIENGCKFPKQDEFIKTGVGFCEDCGYTKDIIKKSRFATSL